MRYNDYLVLHTLHTGDNVMSWQGVMTPDITQHTIYPYTLCMYVLISLTIYDINDTISYNT